MSSFKKEVRGRLSEIERAVHRIEESAIMHTPVTLQTVTIDIGEQPNGIPRYLTFPLRPGDPTPVIDLAKRGFVVTFGGAVTWADK